MEPQRPTGDDPHPGSTVPTLRVGAVNYHTGETVILFRRRKRRREVAELLQALVDKHPTGTIYVAWDNADTHEDDEVQAVVRGAAGRLVLLYLPTYSPWLNPIEMLWRHFRREVTHCELFESVAALLQAAQDFFDRHNRVPQRVLSIIGSHIANLVCVYLAVVPERSRRAGDPSSAGSRRI
jgi:transposase